MNDQVLLLGVLQPQCQGTGIPMVHPLLAETQWCLEGMIIRHQEMTTTTQKTGKVEHLNCSYTVLEFFFAAPNILPNIN